MLRALRPSALAVVALALATSIPANAALVTSIPGGINIPIPGVNYFGPGPQTIAPGITWSSTNCCNQGGSVYGSTLNYNFGANGNWPGSLGPLIGLNASSAVYGTTDSMTVSFSNPVGAVGGFINWALGYGATSISVYDIANNLIESAPIDFATGGADNSGQFLGFVEPSAIIGSFVLTDGYIGLTDLTVGNATAVPEPDTLPLLMTGLLGLVVLRRKRKAS